MSVADSFTALGCLGRVVAQVPGDRPRPPRVQWDRPRRPKAAALSTVGTASGPVARPGCSRDVGHAGWLALPLGCWAWSSGGPAATHRATTSQLRLGPLACRAGLAPSCTAHCTQHQGLDHELFLHFASTVETPGPASEARCSTIHRASSNGVAGLRPRAGTASRFTREPSSEEALSAPSRASGLSRLTVPPGCGM